MDYKNIISATYAPITKAWSITDKYDNVQSGVCIEDENESKKAGLEGDEEWYVTLDLDNEIELVISPDVLSERCIENCKERYEGISWLITIQHFNQCTKLCELSPEQMKIEL